MKLGILSVVHHADDARIREKLIPALTTDFEVEYHTRPASPSEISEFAWHPIPGSRLVRNLRLAGRLWSGHFDIVVLVDPETFLAGVLASRHTKVVFDIHENIPDQILRKTISWRRALAALAGKVLSLAERAGSITLAEPGYASLFASDSHPVFENYPAWSHMPDPDQGDGRVVYVGDVTEERGALDLAQAAAQAGFDLVIIGRCDPALEEEIVAVTRKLGGSVELTGRLSWGAAMERLTSAAVAVSPLHDTPNYRHSLPTKVLEYVGVGVPVVATNLPGTAAVLADLPGTMLVQPNDVEALRDALVVMSAPEERVAARRSAGQIRATYAWPEKRVQDFYRDLAGLPARALDK